MLTPDQLNEHYISLCKFVQNGDEEKLKQLLAELKDDLTQLFNVPDFEKKPIWYQALEWGQPVNARLLVEAGAKPSATYQEWQTWQKFYELNSPPVSPEVQAFSQAFKAYVTRELNPGETINRATFRPVYELDPFARFLPEKDILQVYYLSSYLVSDKFYELIEHYLDAIPSLKPLYDTYQARLKQNLVAKQKRSQLPDYYMLYNGSIHTSAFQNDYFIAQLPKINYLHIAVASGDLDLIKWVLNHERFDLNSGSWRKFNPLLKIAYQCKQPLMVAYLANWLFNRSSIIKNGKLIKQNQPLASLDITFDALLSIKPNHPAYRYCLLTTVYTNIKKYHYIEREFILERAIKGGHRDIIEVYFDAAPSSPHLIDEKGNTLLHRAVAEKAMPLLLLGIEIDIELDAKNKQNKTALQLAVDTNQKELAVKLLEHGATVDADYQVKLVNLGVNIAGIIMQVNKRLIQVNKQISATQVAQNQQQAQLITGLLETRNLVQATALEFVDNPQLMPSPAYQQVLVEELGVEPQQLLDKVSNSQLTGDNTSNLLAICNQLMQTVQQQAFILGQHDRMLRQQQALLQDYILNTSPHSTLPSPPSRNTSQANNYLNFFPAVSVSPNQTPASGQPISFFSNPNDRPEPPRQPVAVGLTANDTENIPLPAGPRNFYSSN